MNVWMLATVIVLFFEGAVIGIAPDAWKRTMRQLIELPSSSLRKMGIALALVALILLLITIKAGS